MKAIVKSNPKQMLQEGRELVRFQFHHPDAKAVFVAGSFNDWHPGASEMVRLEGDLWVKDLVLEPGKYEYLFVVDGVWKTDPKAAENAPNPFGGANSILYVKAPETSRGATLATERHKFSSCQPAAFGQRKTANSAI